MLAGVRAEPGRQWIKPNVNHSNRARPIDFGAAPEEVFEHLADIRPIRSGAAYGLRRAVHGWTDRRSFCLRFTGHLTDRSTSGVFQVDHPRFALADGRRGQGVGIDSVSEYRLTAVEGGTRLTWPRNSPNPFAMDSDLGVAKTSGMQRVGR
jgi:hypothetical protein